tara:strand:- start:533 stop:766 length:234 start_codon:yes stop_codon:yes gene_type:complete
MKSMAGSDAGIPTINWTRVTVIGAFAGGTFWAVSLYALLTSDGALAAWTAVGVAAVALLVAGALLSRTRRAAAGESG